MDLGFEQCTALSFSVPLIEHISTSISPPLGAHKRTADTRVSLFITARATVLTLPAAWLACQTPPSQRITEQVRLKMQAMPLTVEAILLTAWD